MKKVQMLLTFFAFSLFFLKGVTFLDPDFGWHLRMGELILSDGIPATDPFSYTMPSFPFIDHEWLTNVLIALSFPHIGRLGLSFISAVLMTSVLFISIGRNWYKWTITPFLLGAVSILGAGGVRPQIITLFFLSIFVAIVLNKNNWEKLKWILPLLLVVWTNLHGGFAVGVFVIFIVVIAKSIESRKIDVFNILLLMFSIFATFVNPYKTEVWREVWMTVSDQSLRWQIAEWIPSVFILSLSGTFLLMFTVFFILRYRKKFELVRIVLFAVLFFFGLSSIRHFPLWAVISFPMLNTGFLYFRQDVTVISKGLARFSKACNFLIVLTLIIIAIDLTHDFYRYLFYSEKAYYPYNAAAFLKKNPSSGQIFSAYDWGGYLIWKLPEKKVFIDGRMPSWKWKANASESSYAFMDYNKILKGEIPFSNIVKKYNIDTVLLPVNSEKKNLVTKLEETLSNKLLFRKEKEYKTQLVVQIKQLGMKEIYKDNICVLYRR